MASASRAAGTSWPNSTAPIRRASTNLISPALTFLSSFIAGSIFRLSAALRFNWVGSPARRKRRSMRSTSLAGRPRTCAESFAASDLADGDRFPVEVFAVMGNGFEGMADGVAEIQDGPQAALGLVLPNHLRFDLAAAGHDGG